MSGSKQKDGKIIFDYIVVGTGPAGSVVAKKLTDDKKTSVLVLEAGENNDRDTPISNSTFALELEEMYLPQYFWQGEGVPQEKVNERSFEWTTGRLLGGGTSINTQQYVRPTSAVKTYVSSFSAMGEAAGTSLVTKECNSHFPKNGELQWKDKQ